MENRKSVVILLAEDDEDDHMLIKKALEQSRIINDLHWVKDGEEFMDYLLHQGQYQDEKASPKPGLILLDLNMPKKDGRQALKEIKGNTKLRQIPVVVLTTSKEEEDVFHSYDLGANSFVRKPEGFDHFIDIIKDITHYWFDIVEMPEN